MNRRFAILALLAFAVGPVFAEPAVDTNFPLRVRYWQNYRERQRTTRYGYPPVGGTNSIPAGYHLLEYVESTGAQCVYTGLADVPATLSFTYVFENLSSDSTWRGIVGARYLSTAYGSKAYNVFARNGKARLDVTGRSLTVDTVGTNTLVYTRQTTTFNGTTYENNQKDDLDSKFYLFAFGINQNNDGGASSRAPQRLFSCSISTNDVLVRDYVPVADTNGVAGLWDRVSGTMFYSATSTPLVAGPELRPATVLPTVSRETVREMLAPIHTGEPPELAGGDLWLDCLAIPEGNWLCECPIEGTTNTAWRAALCPSNILRSVVWRHATGIAPTNLPVTLEHDPSRVIGRIERLVYEAGTGVVARISVTRSGYAWAVSNRCDRPSPDVRAMFTNLVVRADGWTYEHQDYVEARCVPRGEDCSFTNAPTAAACLVMMPVYLTGLSLVHTPLLPTYIERPAVRDDMRDAYPANPRREWDWRNGY